MSFSTLVVLSIMCSTDKNGNFDSPSARKLRNEVEIHSRLFLLSVNLQSLLNLLSSNFRFSQNLEEFYPYI